MRTSRVQRRISKLIDAYSEGLIEKREFEPHIRDARVHLEKLKLEMRSQKQLQGQLAKSSCHWSVGGVCRAGSWPVGHGLLDACGKLISTLVKRIEIGTEEVRIVYRVSVAVRN